MSLHPEIRNRAKRPKGIRHRFAPLLISSGIVILGFVGVQYGTMFLEQRHLRALWQAQQQESTSVHPARVALRDSGLTRLSIPAIDFSAVIVEGTDPFSLLMGPGHMTGTSMPGDAGNSVISAHRDTFFRRIANLRRGDHIIVERDGRKFTYGVDEFKIVKPDDVSVIAPSKDDRMTLVTCDPAYFAGLAPQRLVVISRLMSAQPANRNHPPSATGKPLPSRTRIRPTLASRPRPHYSQP